MSDSEKAFASKKWRFIQRLLTSERLKPNEVRIAGVLIVKYHNKNYDVAWPSIETLSKDVHLTSRTVRRSIANLTNDDGPFEAVGGRKGGLHNSNIYRPRWDWTDETRTPLSTNPDTAVTKPGHPCPPNLPKNLPSNLPNTPNKVFFEGEKIRDLPSKYCLDMKPRMASSKRPKRKTRPDLLRIFSESNETLSERFNISLQDLEQANERERETIIALHAGKNNKSS